MKILTPFFLVLPAVSDVNLTLYFQGEVFDGIVIICDGDVGWWL